METLAVEPIQNSKVEARAIADTNVRAGWGIAVLRVAIGVVFLAHGWQKLTVYGLSGVTGMMRDLGIPFPALSAALATFTELLGGLALIVGFQTRWVSLPLAFTMLVALVTAHLGQGFFLPSGLEYVLVLLSASVALALLGSGSGSVDIWLQRRKQERE